MSGIFWFTFGLTTMRLRNLGFCVCFFLMFTGTCSFFNCIFGRFTGLASNTCSVFWMTVTATNDSATTTNAAWIARLTSAALDFACFSK